MNAGQAMAGVVVTVFVACLSVLGGCDDLSSRRPVAPTCNVVELECD